MWGRRLGNKLSFAVKALAVLTCAVVGTHVFAQSAVSPYTSAKRCDAIRQVSGAIAPDLDGEGPPRYLAVRYTYDRSSSAASARAPRATWLTT